MCAHTHKSSTHTPEKLHSCQKATLLVSKSFDTKLSLKEQVRLFIHLLQCTACRIFKKQNVILQNELKRLRSFTENEQTYQLSAQSKEQLTKVIKEAVERK